MYVRDIECLAILDCGNIRNKVSFRGTRSMNLVCVFLGQVVEVNASRVCVYLNHGAGQNVVNIYVPTDGSLIRVQHLPAIWSRVSGTQEVCSIPLKHVLRTYHDDKTPSSSFKALGMLLA